MISRDVVVVVVARLLHVNPVLLDPAINLLSILSKEAHRLVHVALESLEHEAECCGSRGNLVTCHLQRQRGRRLRGPCASVRPARRCVSSDGRCSSRMSPPASARTAAAPTICSSCRTWNGRSNSAKAWAALAESEAASQSTIAAAMASTSSRRSRSGGTRTVHPAIRAKRSPRNQPSFIPPSRSLWVAHTIRTSTFRGVDRPAA